MDGEKQSEQIVNPIRAMAENAANRLPGNASVETEEKPADININAALGEAHALERGLDPKLVKDVRPAGPGDTIE